MDAERDTQVADLLRQSRAAHGEYRSHKPRFDTLTKQPVGGDATNAREALKRAALMRTQAHVLDPKHEALAWNEDRAGHDDLLNFYVQELAK